VEVLDQNRHDDDLRIVLVGAGLLGVEDVDLGRVEHGGKDGVAEGAEALGVAGLVEALERLEEGGAV